MAKFTAQAGIDPLLRVDLDPGDEVAAERGSMVMMDAGLILKGKTRGGFFKSLARKFLNDETFFQQWIAAEDQAGTAYLAPSLPGGVKVLDVKDDGVMIADGCFLAATAGIDISAKAQGLGRAILSDSGGFFIMKAEGAGTLAVSGFGSLEEVEVTPDRPLLIDNGHLVAWDASLDYEITLQTGRSGAVSLPEKVLYLSSPAAAELFSAHAAKAASLTGSSRAGRLIEKRKRRNKFKLSDKTRYDPPPALSFWLRAFFRLNAN